MADLMLVRVFILLNTGFEGRDSFKYAVCDNQSPTVKCDSDWVYIRVTPVTFKNTTNAVDDYGQVPSHN